MMTIPVYDWIAHYASTRGECVAMEDLGTGRQFTYAEFDRRVGRLASGLRARYGVARGDRVAVLAHNSLLRTALTAVADSNDGDAGRGTRS